jgi:hypothetical protein
MFDLNRLGERFKTCNSCREEGRIRHNKANEDKAIKEKVRAPKKKVHGEPKKCEHDKTKRYCEICNPKYEEQNIKKSARERAYREANLEKVRAREKVYRDNNKEKVQAQRKAYEEANKEKVQAQRKVYREANKEKISDQAKARWRKKNWCDHINDNRIYCKTCSPQNVCACGNYLRWGGCGRCGAADPRVAEAAAKEAASKEAAAKEEAKAAEDK